MLGTCSPPGLLSLSPWPPTTLASHNIPVLTASPAPVQTTSDWNCIVCSFHSLNRYHAQTSPDFFLFGGLHDFFFNFPKKTKLPLTGLDVALCVHSSVLLYHSLFVYYICYLVIYNIYIYTPCHILPSIPLNVHMPGGPQHYYTIHLREDHSYVISSCPLSIFLFPFSSPEHDFEPRLREQYPQ